MCVSDAPSSAHRRIRLARLRGAAAWRVLRPSVPPRCLHTQQEAGQGSGVAWRVTILTRPVGSRPEEVLLLVTRPQEVVTPESRQRTASLRQGQLRCLTQRLGTRTRGARRRREATSTDAGRAPWGRRETRRATRPFRPHCLRAVRGHPKRARPIHRCRWPRPPLVGMAFSYASSPDTLAAHIPRGEEDKWHMSMVS